MQETSREYILELDKKRKLMEEEIMNITEYLSGEGMPGVKGSLIDNEGFPLPNIDIPSIRTARNKLVCLQNDLKNLMEVIEKNMQVYFNLQQENKTIIEPKKIEVDKSEPIHVQVFEDEPKINKNMKIPFAWVGLVSSGSPAEEAGLQVGDGIINFNRTVFYGATNNPLQKIAEIVSQGVNKEIPVDIIRKTPDEEGNESIEYLTITLIPHQWSGNGYLG
jgi:26S proteasome non-ATPase regulatory subunit 9